MIFSLLKFAQAKQTVEARINYGGLQLVSNNLLWFVMEHFLSGVPILMLTLLYILVYLDRADIRFISCVSYDPSVQLLFIK